VVYFNLACVTYGIGVPSGLFVPSLLTGAAFGRICGEGFAYAGMLGTNVDRARVGVYALIGAAAMLAGMARITISLTVILIECTNDEQYGLPIMVTVMFAKWVGDIFNEGLYDIHIHLKHVPFLEPFAEREMDAIRLEDIMSRRVESLPMICQVEAIIDSLRETSHMTYPVVKSRDRQDYVGMMRRDFLCTILSWRNADGMRGRIFQDTPDERPPPTEPWHLMEVAFPVYPTLEEAVEGLSDREMKRYINLRPYMNQNAYTLRKGALVTRGYNLFRTMGVRSIPVLDGEQVVGMITRENLLHDSIHEGEEVARMKRPHEWGNDGFVPDTGFALDGVQDKQRLSTASASKSSRYSTGSEIKTDEYYPLVEN